MKELTAAQQLIFMGIFSHLIKTWIAVDFKSTAIHQVKLNLFFNAVKFGTLTCEGISHFCTEPQKALVCLTLHFCLHLSVRWNFATLKLTCFMLLQQEPT